MINMNMTSFDKRLAHQQLQLAEQLQQIVWAAPQVIAQRTLRMVLAGATPSARDREEITRMWAEKPAAFGQAWWSMLQQSGLIQQRWALQGMQLWTRLLFGGTALSASQMNGLWQSWARQQAHANLDIGNRGLRPIRRRAVSNARRLSR